MKFLSWRDCRVLGYLSLLVCVGDRYHTLRLSRVPQPLAPISAATMASLSECQKLALGRPMNLNVATERDFRCLPGIGRAIARRIVIDRAERGTFRDVNELQRVKGIGPKNVQRLASELRSSELGAFDLQLGGGVGGRGPPQSDQIAAKIIASEQNEGEEGEGYR